MRLNNKSSKCDHHTIVLGEIKILRKLGLKFSEIF